MHARFVLLCLLLVTLIGLLHADEEDKLLDNLDCSPAPLAVTLQAVQNAYPLDTEDMGLLQQHLFQLSLVYQEIALTCGYSPNEAELNTMMEQTLSVATLSQLIEVTAVGYDVDRVLEGLETVSGDSFNGQLLYNSLVTGIDGTELSCSKCHEGEEATAPLTAGTWTRADEIRLQTPELAGYTIERYFVESILNPSAYIVPDYNGVMPANFGSRMDLQQLADLIAYLESQDQEIDESP